jgi:hypothetical protein
MKGVSFAIKARIRARAMSLRCRRVALFALASPALSSLGARDWACLSAQAFVAPTLPVEGAVLDATTSQPIRDAEVLLAAMPSTPRSLRIVRRTDTTGVYRFDAVADGDYVLQVRALGYAPRRLVAHLDAKANPHLAIGLQWLPRVLAPVRIDRRTEDSFARTASPVVDRDTRARAERLRQNAFLVGDAHALTYAEVATTVGLGEADPLRALQHAPGVAWRDDYSSALWTRGAAGDQTRVIFDGVPLFDPMHAIGAVSVFNGDAIGSTIFHSSVQPITADGGLAGLVDVTSRHGARDQPAVLGGLSMLAGRVATGGALESGRVAWTFGLRRSYVDLLSRGLANVSGHADQYLPYAYGDLTGRVDLRLTDAWRIEASTLLASDRLRNSVNRVLRDASADWGSSAGRVTLVGAIGRWETRQSVSASEFHGTVNSLAQVDSGVSFQIALDSSAKALLERVYSPQPITSGIRYVSVDGNLRRREEETTAGLTLAYRLVHEDARFATTGVWPYRRELIDPLSTQSSLDYASVAASDRLSWGNKLSVDAGLRAEVGGAIAGAPRVRWAPQTSVRYQPVADFALWSAAGVQYQHEQTIKPQAPGRDGVVTDGVLWMLAGPAAPLARARVLSGGIERWLGTDVLLSATAFARNSDGLAVSDPRPGPLLDRPLFVVATGHAAGVELSARRLAGPWTGGVTYTRSRSLLAAQGLTFAAPTHRPDVLYTNLDRYLGGGLRFGASYTSAAGVAYTREHPGAVHCDLGGCDWRIAPSAEAPSAQRGAPYRSLDVSAEWTREWGRRRLSVFAQVHNVANQQNDAAYTSTEGYCAAEQVGVLPCNPIYNASGYLDKRLPALGMLPTLGVTVAF